MSTKTKKRAARIPGLAAHVRELAANKPSAVPSRGTIMALTNDQILSFGPTLDLERLAESRPTSASSLKEWADYQNAYREALPSAVLQGWANAIVRTYAPTNDKDGRR